MTDDHRRKLLDTAALWLLIGVALVALGVRGGHALVVLLAWFPIRWGLARVVGAATAPPLMLPPAADKPFGYKPGGPVR